MTTPILVLNGIETWPDVRQTSISLAGMLPAAAHLELPGGRNHEIPVASTAAALREFLQG